MDITAEVGEVTAELKQKLDRLNSLLSVVIDGSSPISSQCERACDAQQEYNSDAEAVLAVQSYAAGYKPGYLDQLKAELSSVEDGITFNEDLIKGDPDLMEEAIAYGVFSEDDRTVEINDMDN
jgi:hypothetical protein